MVLPKKYWIILFKAVLLVDDRPLIIKIITKSPGMIGYYFETTNYTIQIAHYDFKYYKIIMIHLL
jgi:hypothetical protein